MGKIRDCYAVRAKEFEEDAPDGWWPDFEEEVFLPPRSPFLMCARGVITRTLDQGVFEVSYRYGRQFRKVRLEIAELRPTGFKIEWRGSRAVFVRKNDRITTGLREWIYSERIMHEIVRKVRNG